MSRKNELGFEVELVSTRDIDNKIKGKIDLYNMLTLNSKLSLTQVRYHLPKINYVPI